MKEKVHTIVQRSDRFVRDCASSKDIYQPRLDESLLILMGCPLPSTAMWPMIEARNLKATQECLPRLLKALGPRPKAPVDATSVLAGMGRHRCWRRCLFNEGDAYFLAVALINFTATYDQRFSMDVTAERDVLAILNGWLKPPTRWRSAPSGLVICEHLFGTAWSVLALPQDKGSRFQLADIVDTARPPFKVGLCPAQDAIPGIPLPDLVCAL